LREERLHLLACERRDVTAAGCAGLVDQGFLADFCSRPARR
jgi:hypothetical protein